MLQRQDIEFRAILDLKFLDANAIDGSVTSNPPHIGRHVSEASGLPNLQPAAPSRSKLE